MDTVVESWNILIMQLISGLAWPVRVLRRRQLLAP